MSELHKVTVSTIVDSTPEGMFRMSRLADEQERLYAQLSEGDRRMAEAFQVKLERQILFGDDISGD